MRDTVHFFDVSSSSSVLAQWHLSQYSEVSTERQEDSDLATSRPICSSYNGN